MGEAREHVQNNPETAYDRSDWPIGTIGLALLGIVIFLVTAPFVLMAVFPRAASDVSRTLTADPPAPRLQTDPSEDLTQFRIEEKKRLDSYYWIDKQKGIVHIPIEQAMKKLAEQGIDGFPRGQP